MTTAELLLKHGARANIVNNDKQLAYQLAEGELKELLKKATEAHMSHKGVKFAGMKSEKQG